MKEGTKVRSLVPVVMIPHEKGYSVAEELPAGTVGIYAGRISGPLGDRGWHWVRFGERLAELRLEMIEPC